jgi:tetratricopeptide (TPR) repeat protein
MAAIMAGMCGFWAWGMFSFEITMISVLVWVFIALAMVLPIAHEDERTLAHPHRTLAPWRPQNVLAYAGILCVVPFVAVWLNVQPVRADQIFRDALHAERQRDYQKAVTLLEQARATYSHEVQYDLYLVNDLTTLAGLVADASQQQTLLTQAQETLRAVQAREWQGYFFFSLTGRLDLQEWRATRSQEHLDQALAAYQQAATLAPHKASVMSDWGEAYWVANQFDSALEKYQQAAAFYQNRDQQAYHDLQADIGKALYALGRYDEAIGVLEPIFKPGRYKLDSFEARYYLAASYLVQKQYSQALPHATQAVKLYPSVAAHTVLMEIYVGLGEMNEAKQEAESIIELEPANKRAQQVMKLR